MQNLANEFNKAHPNRFRDDGEIRISKMQPGESIQLDYWAEAEKYLMELQKASTWFLGQNQAWLSIEDKR